MAYEALFDHRHEVEPERVACWRGDGNRRVSQFGAPQGIRAGGGLCIEAVAWTKGWSGLFGGAFRGDVLPSVHPEWTRRQAVESGILLGIGTALRAEGEAAPPRAGHERNGPTGITDPT